MTKPLSRVALAAAIIAGVSGAHLLAITTTTPARAADTILSSRTVQFDQVSFTCGETNDSGKVVRFIRAAPALKYLPEFEPAATDPLSKSWNIVYRNICDRGASQPSLTANLSDNRH